MEQLRAALAKYVEERHGGVMAGLAVELGLHQSGVQRFLHGGLRFTEPFVSRIRINIPSLAALCDAALMELETERRERAKTTV